MWEELIKEWVERYDCTFLPPVDPNRLSEASSALRIPRSLQELYRACNGLELEWFRLFPLEDQGNLKRTWDSLERANDHQIARFLGGNKGLLDRFLVFASMAVDSCACLERETGAIWYQAAEKLHDTDFVLNEFIASSLREAAT
ncbi:MAG: SMI1/KNR4 family protein [bacterium]|nr:SMI1/KNR4 family protein [bacterium]